MVLLIKSAKLEVSVSCYHEKQLWIWQPRKQSLCSLSRFIVFSSGKCWQSKIKSQGKFYLKKKKSMREKGKRLFSCGWKVGQGDGLLVRRSLKSQMGNFVEYTCWKTVFEIKIITAESTEQERFGDASFPCNFTWQRGLGCSLGSL